MTTTATSFYQRLSRLEADFRARLPTRLKAIRQEIELLASAPHLNSEFDRYDLLINQVHSLAGTAGCFGLSDLGERAGEFERFLLYERNMPIRHIPVLIDRAWCFYFTLKSELVATRRQRTNKFCPLGIQRNEITSPPMTILVASDDAHTRGFLELALSELGHTAVAVIDGDTAVNRAAKFQFDLAIVDAFMPHVDGFQTATRIVNTPLGLSTTLLLMTALTTPAHIERCYQYSKLGVLLKPLHIPQLSDLLNTIEKSRATQ